MQATLAKPVTYTHCGRRARIGYQQHGKLFNHYEPKVGRAHALNYDAFRRVYVAVCGETVPVGSSDSFDQGGVNPVCKASEGRVTCKRCLARKPVVAAPVLHIEYRLMFTTAGGETDCWTSSKRRNEVDTVAMFAFLHNHRAAVRVWVEERTVTTNY